MLLVALDYGYARRMTSLRQRNRINAMRSCQRTALDRFEAEGFDAVRVEEIAAEVGMAASTIYRHFGTKEQIVLWDEHDPAISEAIEVNLKTMGVYAAVRAAFVDTIGSLYTDDDGFQLRRVRYIYATPELHAAAVEQDLQTREELAAGIAPALPRKERSMAPVIAACSMLAIDLAMERWQEAKGKKPLKKLLAEAFDQIESLDPTA